MNYFSMKELEVWIQMNIYNLAPVVPILKKKDPTLVLLIDWTNVGSAINVRF